jgi:hypothetical protein
MTPTIKTIIVVVGDRPVVAATAEASVAVVADVAAATLATATVKLSNGCMSKGRSRRCVLRGE